MMITRTSPFTGITRTKDIPVTEEQFARWQAGFERIQDAMPYLSASDREFIMTGITDEEWDQEFGEDA